MSFIELDFFGREGDFIVVVIIIINSGLIRYVPAHAVLDYTVLQHASSHSWGILL